MTTEELIAALKLADPSGKLKVVIAQQTTYFVAPLNVPEIRAIDRDFYEQCELSTGIRKTNIGENVVII